MKYTKGSTVKIWNIPPGSIMWDEGYKNFALIVGHEKIGYSLADIILLTRSLNGWYDLKYASGDLNRILAYDNGYILVPKNYHGVSRLCRTFRQVKR